MPRWRTWSAAVSLAAIPVWLVALAFPHELLDPGLLVGVGGLAAASFGLSRRSVLVHVLSRAVAWSVFAPTALATAGILLGDHRFDGQLASLALASGAALLLARPALTTSQARAEFAPVAYRRWFLASAVAAALTAEIVALAALDALQWHHPVRGLAFCALSVASLASAVGVVRMRAWGVLLGGVTALAALGSALIVGGGGGLGLAMAAAPGVMFGMPVLASRLRGDTGSAPRGVVPMRVEEPRIRVAIADEQDLDEARAESRTGASLRSGAATTP
jgi:hypothetical protein